MSASDPAIASRICENAAHVRENITAAIERSGRTTSVRLIGVTKYVEPEIARIVFEAGVTQLGESRPQGLWKKADALSDLPVSWHMIGHLQRNKVKRTVEIAEVIQSVDSLRLLQEIDSYSATNALPVKDVLLEVNISGDVAKHGFHPIEIEPLIPELANLKHVHVTGLMTMSGLESSPDQTRREFAALRELRDRIQPKCPPDIALNELSMGMSDDYEIAIEEGATIVRIGSALFEGVKP